MGTSVWTVCSSVTARLIAGTPQTRVWTAAVTHSPAANGRVTAGAHSCVRPPGSLQIPPCVGGFSCDNRTCVNMSQVCNGVPDCPRGEDEAVCGESSRQTRPFPAATRVLAMLTDWILVLCSDRTVPPPGSRNATDTCSEFTCMDGSCIPFNKASWPSSPRGTRTFWS